MLEALFKYDNSKYLVVEDRLLLLLTYLVSCMLKDYIKESVSHNALIGIVLNLDIA